jgi:hypothetical protein
MMSLCPVLKFLTKKKKMEPSKWKWTNKSKIMVLTNSEIFTFLNLEFRIVIFSAIKEFNTY